MPWQKQFKNVEEYNAWYRSYRKKNAEKLRAYYRKYAKKYRAKNGYHNERNSKKRYPEKQRARQILMRAIKVGFIVRKNCEKCGEKAQGHHEDYNKPLEVKWLCSLHHSERHKELKAQ